MTMTSTEAMDLYNLAVTRSDQWIDAMYEEWKDVNEAKHAAMKWSTVEIVQFFENQSMTILAEIRHAESIRTGVLCDIIRDHIGPALFSEYTPETVQLWKHTALVPRPPVSL